MDGFLWFTPCWGKLFMGFLTESLGGLSGSGKALDSIFPLWSPKHCKNAENSTQLLSCFLPAFLPCTSKGVVAASSARPAEECFFS